MRKVPRDTSFPRHLVVFDGRPFGTYEDWCDAFDAWCDAREAFEAEHEVVLPVGRELGECPNPYAAGGPMCFPHGGGWGPRDDGDTPYYARTDVTVVCAEHGLAPGEH